MLFFVGGTLLYYLIGKFLSRVRPDFVVELAPTWHRGLSLLLGPMKPLECGTSRSKVRSTSRLALLVLVGAFLKLDLLPILDGKKLEVEKESAGKERTDCKRSSSPSKEVARAVVSLLDRSSRLGPQLPKGKVHETVLIRGAPGRKEELITPVPSGLGFHVATQVAQATRERSRSNTLIPSVLENMVTTAWGAGPVGLRASRVSWRGEQWWVCRLLLRQPCFHC